MAYAGHVPNLSGVKFGSEERLVLAATDASASLPAAEAIERNTELLGELGARQLEFQATMPESVAEVIGR
jgi:hypothetical protein